jgi:hypothetical protein
MYSIMLPSWLQGYCPIQHQVRLWSQCRQSIWKWRNAITMQSKTRGKNIFVKATELSLWWAAMAYSSREPKPSLRGKLECQRDPLTAGNRHSRWRQRLQNPESSDHWDDGNSGGGCAWPAGSPITHSTRPPILDPACLQYLEQGRFGKLSEHLPTLSQPFQPSRL